MRQIVLTAAFVGALALTGCSTNTAVTTTTTPAPLAILDLSPDGLGDVLFGVDPDTVIADISARFGEPDHDSRWIPAEPNIYGSCPGNQMRAIGWGSLVAIFIDDGSSDLGGWFYTYTYGYDYSKNTGGIDPRGMELLTASGIGIGSSTTDLRIAFGDDLSIAGDEDLDVWSFAAETAGFRGLLSGSEDEDTVTLIEPTDGCD